MTTNYINDLKICEAATSGPWEFGYYNICSKEEAQELAGLDYEATKDSVGVRPHGFGAFVQDTDIKVANSGYSAAGSEGNARYIAYFNPAHMIERIKREQGKDAELKCAIENADHFADEIIKKDARIAELEERLMVEREQFKAIRAYTQDGKLAAICADHEAAIQELLK